MGKLVSNLQSHANTLAKIAGCVKLEFTRQEGKQKLCVATKHAFSNVEMCIGVIQCIDSSLIKRTKQSLVYTKLLGTIPLLVQKWVGTHLVNTYSL